MRQAERGDLTQGAIGRGMLLFALPFLGSSLIQQLYNTVDLIFVGRLLGTDAAAAVGAGSLLITLVLGFFSENERTRRNNAPLVSQMGLGFGFIFCISLAL